MPCQKCGGIIGPHSDICLDCGHDTIEITREQRVMAFIIVLVVFSLFCWLLG